MEFLMASEITILYINTNSTAYHPAENRCGRPTGLYDKYWMQMTLYSALYACMPNVTTDKFLYNVNHTTC